MNNTEIMCSAGIPPISGPVGPSRENVHKSHTGVVGPVQRVELAWRYPDKHMSETVNGVLVTQCGERLVFNYQNAARYALMSL